MKIKANIYAVESNGESMKISAQGEAQKAPKWMEGMSTITATFPATKTNQKAFHLGRVVEFTIKAK